ncbi:MAG TPA: D-2-hydroxyacid dehydrogenase [Acidimicrobiales bacterium]|nr:D-2-hydroxyacid dehydrogenase [Acidimicrobiales bacterium]
MEVLISELAAARFGDRIRAVAPDIRLLRMQDDASLVDDDGCVVARDDAAPDIAWLTSDLFDEGGPIRKFMGMVRYGTSLKWFQSSAAGTDEPVFAEVVRRGTRLTTSHVNYVSISEYVIRAALDHFQQAERWRAAQAAGEWRVHQFREVRGTTWLVVGLGAIGGAVAERARVFGAEVIGVRRHPQPGDPVDRAVGLAEVHTVLGEVDVVVLSVPANSTTAGLVDARFLAAMKPGSLLVNVGRGAVVDEDALHAALDRGVPARAALDVMAVEPVPADSWMWTHPRLVLTPHNSASGDGRRVRAAELFCENLRRYQAGEPLLHEVTEADLDR